jgi:hypothetical protein
MKAKGYVTTFRTSFTRKMLTTSFSGIFSSLWTITHWISANPAFMRSLRERESYILNSLKRLMNDVLNVNLVNDVLNVVEKLLTSQFLC